jgi:hypothetical protein
MIFVAYVFALLISYLGQIYPDDIVVVALLLELDIFAMLLTFSARISSLFEKKEILGLINYPSGSLTLIFGIMIANSLFLLPLNLVVILSSPTTTGFNYFMVLFFYSVSYSLISYSVSITAKNIGTVSALSLIYLVPVIVGASSPLGQEESFFRNVAMLSPVSGPIFVPTQYFGTLVLELIVLLMVGVGALILASWNFRRRDIL